LRTAAGQDAEKFAGVIAGVLGGCCDALDKGSALLCDLVKDIP
jgi:hypothetical protein